MPPELDIWWAKRKLYEKRRLDHSCLHCFVFPTWGKGTLCYTSYIFNSLTFNKYARIICTSVIIINKPEGVSKMSSLMSDHKIGNLSFHLRITLQNLLCSAMGNRNTQHVWSGQNSSSSTTYFARHPLLCKPLRPDELHHNCKSIITWNTHSLNYIMALFF